VKARKKSISEKSNLKKEHLLPGADVSHAAERCCLIFWMEHNILPVQALSRFAQCPPGSWWLLLAPAWRG
jgi:hypothetical protein